MKYPAIYMLVFMLTYPAAAQWEMGANIGIVEYTVTSPQLVTKTQDIVVWSHVLSGGSTFAGVFFKSYLLHKYQIKQELALYSTSHTYKMLVPDNDPGSYFKYFSPVAVIIFTTLNYRALLRVYRIGGLQVRGGLAFDLDFVRTPYEMPPYYAPDYPAAIELEKALAKSFNPVTLFGDIEVEYQIGRFSFGFNYKQNLTSKTGRFVYEGNPHSLRSTTRQWFFKLGFVFLRQDNQKDAE